MPTRCPSPVEWIGDAATGYLRLIDQTQLPGRLAELHCRDVESVWRAIRNLSVRGAPAIGVAAAYGCVIGAQSDDLPAAAAYLATSRPTAVNLFWAIDRLRNLNTDDPARLLDEARAIHAQDAAMCEAIGRQAVHLIKPDTGVLTHCNAGALATAGIGTATAPMYLAHEAGVKFRVFADETRPLLQGARLTAWELSQAGIDVTLITDSMAAQVMRERRIGLVITGADRIAANGDAANKIGTYGVAVLAKHHHIPFYIAAPSSTFDLTCESGAKIPIEQRAGSEVGGPAGVNVYNPAFDVTPAELITGIITESGIIRPVDVENVAAAVSG
ncbi:MAG: S-methyl-5-thioribose-1-phosphate isomerase [Planctomycetes bacterium]|nr:S-methyl-5-thioribose-1-phosphate isomerase [Planctomycetota bacterium]